MEKGVNKASFMESIYNSSFDSDDEVQDEEAKLHRPSNNNLGRNKKNELNSLCKAISELPLVTVSKAPVQRNVTLIHDVKKSNEQSGLQNNNNKPTEKEQTQQKCYVLKHVLGLRMSASSFKGSASINRRRKLKQIEHDNLVSVSNLSILF